jgi:ribosomal protein S1
LVAKKSSSKKTTKTTVKKSLSKKKEPLGVKRPRGEPQTMEDLLAQTDYQIKGLKRGEEVTGKVVNITPKAVYFDIGAKMEGIVANREYEAAKDYIKKLAVGQEISIRVKSPETDSGQILLSLRQASQESVWKNIKKASENDETLEVKGREINRAGLLVDYQGLYGFIPNSQFSVKLMPQLKQLIGKTLKVKVLEFDRDQKRLVLSERLISEADKIKKITQIMKKVKLDQEYQGTVSAIPPFGLFVSIKVGKTEVDGLVHISEISWDKVENLEKMFKVGDEVKIKVIGIDPKENRLALSIKQLTKDPWLEKAKKYPVDKHVKGKVARLAAYGAFVEVEPGLEGLIHISKIPAETKIDVGDKVDCFVEAIEEDKRRLALGLVLKEKPIGYK